MDLYERKKQMTELASVDEADSYEVDEAHIYFDPATGKFALLTASGCSCWDGDFEEEQYDSIDDIEKALTTREGTWNPTAEGAKQLIAEAREMAERLAL